MAVTEITFLHEKSFCGINMMLGTSKNYYQPGFNGPIENLPEYNTTVELITFFPFFIILHNFNVE